jgi:hypothetical protein
MTAVLAGKPKRGTIPPLWDGHAAERIAQVMVGAKVHFADKQISQHAQ